MTERNPFENAAIAQRIPTNADVIVYVDDQGNHRPGLIVQVWDIEAGEVGIVEDATNEVSPEADIVVFKPRKNPTEYISNVRFDASGAPQTWHWHTPRYKMEYEGAVG